jgi:tRNA pseudouridine-54 N-methylase
VPKIPSGYVEIASVPSGLTVTTSGADCGPTNPYSVPAPVSLNWTGATTCSLSVTTPQAGPTGTQYVFANWTDATAGMSTNNPYSVTAPATTDTYTANFTTQYLLTTSAGTGGMVSTGGYYNSGANAMISATPSSGYYFVNFTIVNSNGTTMSTSNPLTLSMTLPQSVTANFALGSGPPAATYVRLDTTTQGTWTGKYGHDGFSIANDSTNNINPSYVTPSFTGDSLYTWSSTTTSPSALQDFSGASGSGNLIASCYYSASGFNINLNLTDGNMHQVALYLLDYDSTRRAETISILNASNNAVLSTQSFSSFGSGEYAVWNITGNVIVQVAYAAGDNAVVSGIFFDPMGTVAAPAATYVRVDTTTQGTWTGKYGHDGFSIANDSTNNINPSYVTPSFTGDSLYTWSSTTTSPIALQDFSGASGSGNLIASAYYSASSFNINVNITDGNTHQVALYLLDYDSTRRAETISILNASTNAVLSTQSFGAGTTTGNFANGQYAIWDITGNVIIQVTYAAGDNAVVSGIFFDPVAAVPPPAATFVTVDTATQGTWTGTYGHDGAAIANDANSTPIPTPPSYATLSVTGDSLYTWSSTTTSPIALQDFGGASGSGNLIASCYYSVSGFNINLNLTDGGTHQIALYLLDYDSTRRAETISILNASTSAVLSTQSFGAGSTTGNFGNGQYAVWDITGNVIIQVTYAAGDNAVVSGIFFDPVP